MKLFSKIISYLLHPVFIPLIATGCYFFYTQEYYQKTFMKFTFLQVSIMTLFLPICLFLMLKSFKVLNSTLMVNDLNERKIPFFFNLLLLGILLFRIWEFSSHSELKIFFLGYFFSYLILFLGVFLKQKISVHTVALTATLPFTIATSIAYSQVLVWQTSALFLLIGLLITARLYSKAHTNLEVVLGLIVGILPQILARHFQIYL